jgi:hypothetical protein
MVICGASQTPYGKDSSGILPKIKIATISDVQAKVFEYTNDKYNKNKDSMDALDGSAYMNAYFAEFCRKSLPGMGISRVQKPIGTSINDFSSTLLKFASYGLNNELMRRSIGNTIDLRELNKKMSNIPFNIDRIFTLKNIGTTLDITSLFDDIHVPINGVYTRIITITQLGNSKYRVFYSNGFFKDYSVKTIDDIYEMFGACFTKNSDGEYTDDSIAVVTTIIEQNEAN